jgi:hypothetical protein
MGQLNSTDVQPLTSSSISCPATIFARRMSSCTVEMEPGSPAPEDDAAPPAAAAAATSSLHVLRNSS